MATTTIDGVSLQWERTGSGPPLVLVHGSWGDRTGWAFAAPVIASSFEVVTYDRRGHTDGVEPGGSVHDDASDLGALIESLDLAPAHVVSNSHGGNVAMRLAARRPELFRSLNMHEPPTIALIATDPSQRPLLRQLGPSLAAVVAKVESGDREGAARQFVDEIALGPGAWDELPPEARDVFVRNADTFVAEQKDPDAFAADVEALAAFDRPVQLTYGDQSPPMFEPIIEALTAKLPNVKRALMPGVGHVPQLTEPERYAQTVTEFALAADAS
jgi:pimeloyl-ACP methyl ester carboxylesterase